MILVLKPSLILMILKHFKGSPSFCEGSHLAGFVSQGRLRFTPFGAMTKNGATKNGSTKGTPKGQKVDSLWRSEVFLALGFGMQLLQTER